MINTNNESSRSKNWRGLESFIGVLAGAGIGETARQIVQYNQVSLVRLVILIVCALVGGSVIGYSMKRPKEATRD